MTAARARVQVFVADEPEQVARGAAADVAEVVRRVPTAAVLFAVGETPVPLYAELAARRATGELDASGIRAVQLDEYAGVAPGDERAFFGWLARDVLGPLAIPPERTIGLRGDAADLAAECERYELAVRRAGGIDLAILGLGLNGHLGFNEPPSDAAAPTRVVDLAEPTIEASAGYWGSRELVPPRGITAGMRVLLAARETILVVTGERKREILHAALEGPVTPDVPASLLRTIDRVRVYADRAAWSG
jgi:glucosamine-6-phosphate deaminase